MRELIILLAVFAVWSVIILLTLELPGALQRPEVVLGSYLIPLLAVIAWCLLRRVTKK